MPPKIPFSGYATYGPVTSDFPTEPDADFSNIEGELELYNKGRELRTVVNHPGWNTVIQTLQDYRDKAVQTLVDLPPGDPTVPTVHAAASALDDQFVKFQQDIEKAIEFAANPSEEVTLWLKGAYKAADVKAAIGGV
jgi:hypothetical protein